MGRDQKQISTTERGESKGDVSMRGGCGLGKKTRVVQQQAEAED